MYLESEELSANNYSNTTSTNSSDLTKVIIGALAGAAAGSLIAGSFTQKGVEIRNRIGEGSKNMASNLKDKVSDVAGTIADKYETAKESAADLLQKGKQKVGMSSAGSTDMGNTSYTGYTGYSSTGVDGRESGSKILLGALIASVVGTIVWSFATDKGNETRRRIAKGSRNMANNLKEKVSDVAGDIAEGVSHAYETAKESAVDLVEQQKQKLNTSGGNPSFSSSTGADNW